MAQPTTEQYRRMFNEFLDQVQSATEESSGTLIAGTGSDETRFSVPRSALEKSPVIKGWIEDQESIPASLQKGDALHFPNCDPQVVHATIEYLKSTTTGLIAILDPAAGGSKDALFYVKVYKFALCLGLTELCAASLHKIKDLTRDTKSFLAVLATSTSEKVSLVEDRAFHDWMMGYLAQKSAVLKESKLFKSAIAENSELAWNLTSLLLSSLGATTNRAGGLYVPASPFSPAQTPPGRASSADPTPDAERRKSRYSFTTPQKSPTPRPGANRVQKPQKQGAKKFCATVEDDVGQ